MLSTSMRPHAGHTRGSPLAGYSPSQICPHLLHIIPALPPPHPQPCPRVPQRPGSDEVCPPQPAPVMRQLNEPVVVRMSPIPLHVSASANIAQLSTRPHLHSQTGGTHHTSRRQPAQPLVPASSRQRLRQRAEVRPMFKFAPRISAAKREQRRADDAVAVLSVPFCHLGTE